MIHVAEGDETHTIAARVDVQVPWEVANEIHDFSEVDMTNTSGRICDEDDVSASSTF